MKNFLLIFVTAIYLVHLYQLNDPEHWYKNIYKFFSVFLSLTFRAERVKTFSTEEMESDVFYSVIKMNDNFYRFEPHDELFFFSSPSFSDFMIESH